MVIATYNEAENLPALVEQIFHSVQDCEILVVDDNSPDGTGDWARGAAGKDSRIRLISRPGKLGLGSATKLGLQTAIRENFDWVATMDADHSHDPSVLAEMLDIADDGADARPDVVIGSRYVPGGKIIGWPWYRRISSALVNSIARLLLGLKTADNTSAFRLYSVDKLKEINIEAIESQGYSYLEEILVLLNFVDARFFEVPIVFQNREKGNSKVDFRELYRSLFQIVRLSLRRRS